MVRDLWWKAFTKIVSFKFRVKEWWMEKVVRRKVVEISMKRWNWFTKWSRKFVPEWGEAYWKERSVVFKEEEDTSYWQMLSCSVIMCRFISYFVCLLLQLVKVSDVIVVEIMAGSVGFDSNNNLCFVNTILWSDVVTHRRSNITFFVRDSSAPPAKCNCYYYYEVFINLFT